MEQTHNPVGWFEIPATDLKRAMDFYAHILQAEMTPFDMDNFKMAFFPAKEELKGSMGALVMAESYVPSYDGTMVYFVTDDIPAVLQRVREKGGKVITEKMSIGEFGFVGHFEDCEGNRLGLHSNQ